MKKLITILLIIIVTLSSGCKETNSQNTQQLRGSKHLSAIYTGDKTPGIVITEGDPNVTVMLYDNYHHSEQVEDWKIVGKTYTLLPDTVNIINIKYQKYKCELIISTKIPVIHNTDSSQTDNTSQQMQPSIPDGNILFGRYEQDNNMDNGPEPIEWIILTIDNENNRALLTSRFVLSNKPFNDTTIASSCVWSHCSIYSWLNNDFFYEAFTEEEQSKIKDTVITEWEDTSVNKVFLLSLAEAMSFLSKGELKATPTEYARIASYKYDLYTNKFNKCSWWLRHGSTKEVDKSYAEDYKMVINPDGEQINAPRVNEHEGIRPAIWVDLSLIDND